MQLTFALLSRAAERSQDGTFHAFGAGFDTVQVPHLPAAVMPMVIVAKFRCEPEEKGQAHEVSVDLSDPRGKKAHLATEQIVVGEAHEEVPRSLGPTFVAALNAPFETEGEYIFHVSLDGTQVASLPVTVFANGNAKGSAGAMQIRSQWMRELGLGDEEIAELCDLDAYPTTSDEEEANLSALRRMRSTKWSI